MKHRAPGAFLMQINHSYTDQDLLVAALQGRDKKALSYLYENFGAALYGCILRIVNREEWANEILQDVFLQVWEQIHTFDSSKGRLYTWMFNIARNKSIDKLRSKENQAFRKTDSFDSNVYGKDASDQEVRKTEGIGFDALLNQLTEEERVVVRWTYFKGYSQSETAEATGIPLGTVKTRMRAALGKLRQLIKLENK